jgi:hypothetical protein
MLIIQRPGSFLLGGVLFVTRRLVPHLPVDHLTITPFHCLRPSMFQYISERPAVVEGVCRMVGRAVPIRLDDRPLEYGWPFGAELSMR